jgi:eukaryotic-like serine/threonine-protein kinase
VKKNRLPLALALCALVIPASAPSSGAAEQPAMFRGNPAHTGVYDSAGVPQPTKIKWQFQTKGQVLSSPAVTSDTVYIGSSDHFLYALNRNSGAEKWKFKTDGRITSSPAVSDGIVYFTCYDGNAYAVDASTGTQKWKFALSGERRFAATHLHGAVPNGESMPDPFDFYLSSPVVADGIVYFGSGDTNVYALDATSGQLKWKFETGDVVHASPALADGILYIGSWDSYFYALDAKSGKELWRFKTGEDAEIHNQVGIQSSAAISDGIVYFGCRDSNFYAVDAATGKERWRFNNKGSWVIGSPAVGNGKVYFGTSDTALFYALDAKSGAQLFSLGFHGWPLFSSPALTADRAYLGSHEGKLFAIDLNTQKLAWTFATDGSKKNGATYTKPDGTANYELAFTDFFYDDMVSGVQKLMTVGAVLSSPVVVGDTVYFGSADGNLYALI